MSADNIFAFIGKIKHIDASADAAITPCDDYPSDHHDRPKRGRKPKMTTPVSEVNTQIVTTQTMTTQPLLLPANVIRAVKLPFKVVKVSGEIISQGLIAIKCGEGHLHRYRCENVMTGIVCKTCSRFAPDTIERKLLDLAVREFGRSFRVFCPDDRYNVQLLGDDLTIYCAKYEIFIHLIVGEPRYVSRGKLNINIKRKRLSAESELSLMPPVVFTRSRLRPMVLGC